MQQKNPERKMRAVRKRCNHDGTTNTTEFRMLLTANHANPRE
jgi:hypothetical protein